MILKSTFKSNKDRQIEIAQANLEHIEQVKYEKVENGANNYIKSYIPQLKKALKGYIKNLKP